MIKEIIASGKDVVEAKENARAALGAGPLDDVNFEIIHAGSRGIFGIIGVKPAQVRAYIELPDNGAERRKKSFDKPKKHSNRDGAKPEKNSNQNNRKKPEAKRESKPEESQEPKARVIPEVELKLEKREVKEGEDRSFDFVKTLVSDIGLSAEVELYQCDDGTRRIIIAGEDASTLIGHHGDTLDALQYLANLASAKKNINGERDKSRVTIDIEGYRAKREETLRALARRMAAKALRNRRSVMLEPMSAYERRIIHSEVQSIDGVSTNSIGSDNNRKIVIYLTDKKPKGLFDEDIEVPEIKDMQEEANGDYIAPDLSISDSLNASDETITVEPTIPDENDDIVDDGDFK